MRLDKFTAAYVTAALWSSMDDDGNPLDENYSVDDIAPETLAKIIADCEKFQNENSELITADNFNRETDYVENAGHDFWLTRCGHGCGFWDGEWNESAAKLLTDAAHKFGNVDLYVGDNGKIYS